MLLNPFLTVNHKQSTYYFSEKYAQKQKPFLTLETTKGLDELVKNNQLNQKISQHPATTVKKKRTAFFSTDF